MTMLQKPIYTFKKEEAKLHISKGNSKIGKGIYAFSTLPGNKKNQVMAKGRLLTTVVGTCSKHCDSCFNSGCYAVNSLRLHHNSVTRPWAENTMLLNSGKLWKELDNYLTKKEGKIKIFRINVSGEIQSTEELVQWDEIAKKHPGIRFGLYTKNYEAVDKYMQKYKKFEENFVINISQWHGVADAFLSKYPKGTFNVFEYDDTNRKTCALSQVEKIRLSVIKKCPAVTKEGHHATTKEGKPITCDMCQRCYRKTGETTAVYAH